MAATAKSKHDDNVNNNNNNSTKKGLPEVPLYSNMLSANRKNAQIKGFDFDVDTFENLIDNFVPINNIPIILSGISRKKINEDDLDRFCNIAYGMKFKEAYQFLSGITDMYMRRVFKNLAASGNATAIAINAKHFMKLEDDQKNDAINIRIVNDLNDK